MSIVLLVGLCTAVYVVLFLLGNLYSVSTGWTTPAGTESTDWVLRRNVAFALGLLSSIVCAVGSSLFLSGATAQLVAIGEGALLAAAGASDLRRFHLPLPFTVGGIAIAIAVAFAMQTPLFIMFFAVGWALALILLHAVVSKGSMQLGDHIATLWIALVLPFNGMLALLAGDLANVILARVKGLKGKKVAAAGAWLIFCAALVGIPPYVTWRGSPTTQDIQQKQVLDASAGIMAAGTLSAGLAPWQTPVTGALLTLTEWAGDASARVILAAPGQPRENTSLLASHDVARYAALAHQIARGTDTQIATALDDLATALAHYDVDGVGDANLRLRVERLRLTELSQTIAVFEQKVADSSSQ
ncbi:MAG TPA: hypothetical protein VGK87_16395 [Anaerolineae bacterium]